MSVCPLDWDFFGFKCPSFSGNMIKNVHYTTYASQRRGCSVRQV
jgi:hypothetical protein